MNIERFEIFQKVAEFKSFTEAGYVLNLSQSSISKHIKALEEYYDTQLFERKGNRVELSAAGDRLLEYTKDIINLTKEAEQTIKQVKTIGTETLIIQAEPITGDTILPKIIPVFLKEHPNINVRVIIEVDSINILTKVLNSDVHLGFSGYIPNELSLISIPLYSEELKLIIGSEHPWAKVPPNSIRDFSKQTLVLLRHASGINQFIKNAILKNNLKFNFIIETPDWERFLRMVINNQAIAIFSNYFKLQEDSRIKVLKIPVIDVKRYVHLIYNKQNTSFQALRAFLYFISKKQNLF